MTRNCHRFGARHQ